MSAEHDVNRTAVLNGPVATESTDVPANVAGYSLQERIGAGGYGEVWKAVGPGGLPKAVKILYGRRDSQQAEIELKSLERIRELRHPFLLNIERIEVSDGRLIVVSELADTCMEKRFAHATKEGLKGIPRDELLAYLRDAADALDFMSERGGLQHLDIKPGNLLLQGEHAKVGDFGLTKDITAAGVSMLGGFTPLYSSPEIFEGRPSSKSDQYSLAIVYQTMLTGQPPFAGRTAAQLTAQHLSSKPDLMSLQPADRPVVARGLSKSPQARFASCREFVDALSKRRHSKSSAGGSKNSSYLELPENVKSTRLVSPDTMTGTNAAPALEVEPIRPAPASQLKLSYRPAVFLAIGGIAGHVFQKLKERFQAEYGTTDLPAFPMLYVDTDPRSLVSVRSDEETPGLGEHEVLHFPLRSLKEYRAKENRPLNWLSRRWLYNIPKSGQVEGMRPLGRLALVDHQDQVRERIAELLTIASAPEAVKATADATGLRFENGPPDVYVIAASTGGTGSGAVLDVGYLIREICSQNEMAPPSLAGILLHGTGTARQSSDVQESATISLLQELQHYCTPGAGGSYGLSSNPAAGQPRPFDQTYLVHLGDGLTEDAFAESWNRVAEYLFANVATPGRADFVQWRRCQQDDEGASPTAIRTFGVDSIGESDFDTVHAKASGLCQALTEKWAIQGRSEEPSSSADDSELLAETRELLRELGWTHDQLAQRVIDAVASDPGKSLASFARGQCELVRAEMDNADSRPKALLVRLANELLRQPEGEGAKDNKSLLPVAHDALSQCLPSAEDSARNLNEHLVSLVDHPLRFRGAEAALGEVLGEVETAGKSFSQTLKAIANDIKTTCAPPWNQTSAQPSQAEVREACARLCLQCCSYAIYQAILVGLTQLRKQLVSTSGQLREMRSQVGRLAAQFAASGQSAAAPLSSEIAAFDRYLLSDHGFRLSDLRERSDEPRVQSAMYESATAYCRLTSANDEQASLPHRRNVFPKSATPLLCNTGGGRRVLALIPEASSDSHWRERLVKEFGECVSVRKMPCDQVSVCCEIEGFEISHLVSQFLRHHPHLGEVAERIHARIDIDW